MTFTPRDYELDQEYRQRQMLAAERGRLAQTATAGQPSGVPLETALKLCQAIQGERARQLLSLAAWKCRVCRLKGADGIPAGLSGECHCPAVTARFQRQGT